MEEKCDFLSLECGNYTHNLNEVLECGQCAEPDDTCIANACVSINSCERLPVWEPTYNTGENGPTVIDTPILSGTTTWTEDKSPYLVNTDIEIPGDSIIKIYPGVKVEFQGKYKFHVIGRIEAVGTAEKPILFTVKVKPLDMGLEPEDFYTAKKDDGAVIGWYGLAIDHESKPDSESRPCIIKHCIFEYGVKDYVSYTDGSRTWKRGGAIHVFRSDGTDVIITNNIFRYNYSVSGGSVIELLWSVSPIVIGNLFVENFSSDNYGWGGDPLRGGVLRMTHTRGYAINNTFVDNKAPGTISGAITIFDAGYTGSHNQTNGYFLENNLFYNNLPEGVFDEHNQDDPRVGTHSVVLFPSETNPYSPFVDAENGDYTPVLETVVNSGINYVDPNDSTRFNNNMRDILNIYNVPNVDLYSRDRPSGGIIDVGAIESCE
jgi:hypothetical protein